MTKQEFDEAAALVVRMRKDLELHTDALKQSNAQCAEYLRQNEQLHSLLQTVSAQRDDLQMAKDDITNELAETTKDLAYSRLAVDTMRARDKRFTETIAKCGAAAGEDIGDFIERAVACRDQFHRELVEVRAALASVTEQRDSLKRTLDEWERADTETHERVTANDVADHIVPPVIPLCTTCHGCGHALGFNQNSSAVGCVPGHGCNRATSMLITPLARTNPCHPYHGPCKSATPVHHECR